MLAIFFVCLCLGTNVHAGVIATTSTTTDLVDTIVTSALFDEAAELKNIAETCFNNNNYEELAGYTVRSDEARILGHVLLGASLEAIGLTELRATLNLEPLPKWKHCFIPWPTDSDLASAPSLQAYYDLKEPRSFSRCLDNPFLFEHNVTPAIAYLDKRFPAIRKIFKLRFKKVRESMELVDRTAVNVMIHEFYEVHKRVDRAMGKLTLRKYPDCPETID
ncbi:hypothetical protein B9Z55_011536 [Caenorhabditis nigoni]|uniref:Uncharacterized protein n=1 Tax=Caenorhabditis nigoni TaxID=1611254 RepID=A0A2G5UKS5_9PELO|nr:hypothetical protein B9Z55_011536 [Caenorhabditis nigoni]